MRSCSRIAAIEKPGGPVTLRESPLPDLEVGAILLKTILSEVCGTDCHLLHGKLANVPYPLTPGHVNVGEIVAMNGPVSDLDGRHFKTGDVVTFLDVHETCGACWFCLVGKNPTRCPSRKVYGITYGTEEGLLGGWSEYIYLKPGVRLLRLPETLSPETYMAGGCGMPTGFHAVERATIRLGDHVVIQGSGPVGLNSLAFARMAGADQIILIGAPEERLTLGKHFGADLTLNIQQLSTSERLEKVLELTKGRGADVTIEASGSPQAVSEGMQLTRDGGRYVIVGQYTDNGSIPLNPHYDINRKHLDIRGCWGVEFRHFYLGIQLMTRHQASVPWDEMISARYRLDEAYQALDDVAQMRVIKAIIDPWKH